MTPQWKRITDPADPLYDTVNPYFETSWAGDDQITGASTGVAAISIGPDGQQDGRLHWTFAVDTTADPVHMPGGRRYVCRRIDQIWAPHVQ